MYMSFYEIPLLVSNINEIVESRENPKLKYSRILNFIESNQTLELNKYKKAKRLSSTPYLQNILIK